MPVPTHLDSVSLGHQSGDDDTHYAALPHQNAAKLSTTKSVPWRFGAASMLSNSLKLMVFSSMFCGKGEMSWDQRCKRMSLPSNHTAICTLTEWQRRRGNPVGDRRLKAPANQSPQGGEVKTRIVSSRVQGTSPPNTKAHATALATESQELCAGQAVL